MIGRPKQYASNADRQKAYRARKIALRNQPTLGSVTKPPCVAKEISAPDPRPGTPEWVAQEWEKIKAGR